MAKISPSKPMRVRSFSAKSLYPSQKQKQPSFEDCFFSSISPFLPCYNFIRCKGMRCASPNCDRCYGSRNSLLAPDFTVDFCFAKIAAATNLVSLRETGSSIPLPTPKIKNNRNQMVAVIFYGVGKGIRTFDLQCHKLAL